MDKLVFDHIAERDVADPPRRKEAIAASRNASAP